MSADGTMLNSSFLDYRMPTALDLPMIDTAIDSAHAEGMPGVWHLERPPDALDAAALHLSLDVAGCRRPFQDRVAGRWFEGLFLPAIVWVQLLNGRSRVTRPQQSAISALHSAQSRQTGHGAAASGSGFSSSSLIGV